MKRFRAAYGRLLEWVVAALMVVLFLEVTTGVVFRALGASLAWYDEVASHLLAWLVQSAIPISSALILIAEAAYLVELIGSRAPPAEPGVAIADELQ